MTHEQRRSSTRTRTVRRLCAAASVTAIFAAMPLATQGQSAVESAAVRSVGASTAAGAGGAVAPMPATRVAATGSRTKRGSAPAVQNPTDTGPACVGGLPQPTPVRINAGKSTLINLPEPLARRTLGDPEVADARLVTPQVLYLVAGKIGTTNAILQGRSGRCVVLDIIVAIDTNAVQIKIAELLPAEKNIRVTAVGDSLILTGSVSDTTAAERAIAIANAYVRSRYQQGMGGGSTGPGGAQLAVQGAAPLLARVINMLTIDAAQQVMLEVKVAEVSKKLVERLGVGITGTQYRGDWTYRLLSDYLLGGAQASAGAVRNSGNGINLEAEKRDGLIRILAEPTVMAISGQEGSFLAGGRIYIPVAQNAGGGVVYTLQEETFGVGLSFTPTVLGDGRINLKVAPEVSELSPTGVSFGSSGLLTSSSVLPLINTRRASTTVQLFDGQSFAIGGLIKSSAASAINAFPVLGELPIIGALFRSTDFQDEKTELVFIVTPRLVKPLPPNFVLPTDRVGDPTRQGLIVEGRLDSNPPAPAPSTANPSDPNAPGGMELK